MSTLTTRELEEIERANASGKRPVMFVHGLWLLSTSWARWRHLFEESGFTTIAPGWPDDPESVAEARIRPKAFAGKGIAQVTDHHAEAIAALSLQPAVVGHSFGGMLAQRLAGMGLSAATVAVDPAPFRGVLPLPISALRAAFPVLGNPRNASRAVALTYAEFRFAFANAVTEDEARQLHETYAVPAPGKPLFQAATANLNPWTEAQVDTRNPRRGPLLILSGERDNTVPWALSNAAYGRQRRNPGVTEIREIPGRGHSLTIDSGWREVAGIALAFVRDHLPGSAGRAAATGAPRSEAHGPAAP